MAVTEQNVRDRLRVLCPPELDPALSAADLDQMVRAARVADADGFPPDSYQPWRPSAAYKAGQIVVADPRDGRAYRVTAVAGDGITAATQPDWPASGTVVDGQVTWTVHGPAPWTPTWNINQGVATGWEIKAGKAAHQYTFSAGTDRFDTNELLTNCLKLAARYRQGVATLTTTDPDADVSRWADVLA